jgi:hypothetical protein
MTTREQEAVSKAAKLFLELGAPEVFVFGSALKIWLFPAYRPRIFLSH